MEFNLVSIEIVAQLATTVAVLLTLIGLAIQIQEKNKSKIYFSHLSNNNKVQLNRMQFL